ncbi:MAG: Y-family DNA polymerase [Candidatus Cloacimonadota bacterium]|nr:Y-family DNA polymerase [Candidatus Cloacimonadota bacterium]
MAKETVALVDCNSFYASCEKVFNPYLADKPVGILSNNDGIIVALSNELKKLGITRGTPGFKISKRLMRENNVRMFSSNYTLYGDMSARVMNTLSMFTPDLEIYSIDEAFLSLTGFGHLNLTDYGRQIKKTVLQYTGLPVSVGIGPTKTLAKIANRFAKKHNFAEGVFDITDHPDRDKILRWVEVERIWGVGRKYAKMLRRNGITNAYELTQVPDNWVQKKMTIVGLRLVKELRGISCIDLEMDIKSKKEIVSSKSFGNPVTELQDLMEATSDYCSVAVKKLRSENQVASLIIVFLSTNRFKNEPQYANYAKARLPLSSAYTPDFIHAANIILKKIYRPGYKYKKVGVMLADIMHQSKTPLDFFQPTYLDDHRKVIMDCMDNINNKMGSYKITYASAGIKKPWQMKREKLTPSYTTNWKHIPVVKAI